MEATIAGWHLRTAIQGALRIFGDRKQASRNSPLTLDPKPLHPSPRLRIEARKQPDEAVLRREKSRRREVIARYATKPHSVAEAQSRFEKSNPDSENGKDGAVGGEARDYNEGEGDDEESLQKGIKMARVCDRLIEVFMIEKKAPVEWRKLLSFSEEWPNIRPHFFQRCSLNAKAEEDPKRRGDLLKLARQLKEVDDDMIRHNELLEEIEKNELAVEAIVAKRRKDFTGDFFDHLQNLWSASYKNQGRRDEIAAVANKCLVAIEARDALLVEDEALGEAQLKFDDILNSPSLEAAVNKIDKLAQTQQLDSRLMLLITKAYAAAKESTMMKEEVKDILLHLYNIARGNMQRLVPKEVRIMRHLLSIWDSREQLAALTDAFSPGTELEGANEDLLYTTPEKLLEWIKVVLEAYRTDKQSSLVKEAQKLMNPEIISRVEQLKRVVESQFM